MEKEFYTELVYRQKCPDDYGPFEIRLRTTSWDMGLAELLEMFHTVAIGASWHQIQFEDALAEYLREHGWIVGEKDEESTAVEG